MSKDEIRPESDGDNHLVGGATSLFSRRRYVTGLLLKILVLNLFAIFTVFYALDELKERDLEQAKVQSRNIALGAHQSINNGIEIIDHSLRFVVDEMEKFSSVDIRDFVHIKAHLVSAHKLLPLGHEAVAIANHKGDVIASGLGEERTSINVADRDYFKALQASPSGGLSMSEPIVSRRSGTPVVVFARSYKDHQGHFSGVVLAAIPLAYFQQLISDFHVGEHSVVGVRTQNFSLIARNPQMMGGKIPEFGDRSNISETLRNLVSSGQKIASYHTYAPEEHILRMVTFRRLEQVPIIVIAGIAQEEYLDDWYRVRNVALGLLGLFLLATYIGAWISSRTWKRQADDAARLSDANRQLEKVVQDVLERDKALLAVQEIGNLGTFSLDLGTEVLTASPILKAILGAGEACLLTTRELLQLVYVEDRAAISAYFSQEILSGGRIDRECRIIRQNDGELRWVHLIGKLNLEDDNQPKSIDGAIQDISELKETLNRIEFLAYHDALTHLSNRTHLAERIQQAISQSQRYNELFGICYVDLDDFKPINDTWGHELGDQLLISVAQRLVGCVQDNDTVARIGGDEFVVLTRNHKREIEVHEAVGRILKNISKPYEIMGQSITTTLSVGVAIFPHDHVQDADTLIRHADQAMYEAKRSGKNCVRIFDPDSERQSREHQRRYLRLVQALADDEFVLHYQPMVDLKSGSVIGVEALIRWQHAEQGLLMPGTFLPDIEHTEFTLPLGEWVLCECLQQKRVWADQGIDLRISLNIFGKHLQRDDFVERLEIILNKFPDVSAAGLKFEIVETTAMENIGEISGRIHACRRLGIDFSLDDFGTGYSSLTYFRQLPVDFVKIDRSFVKGMLEYEEDLSVVKSVIEMAHNQNRLVIAEGVETLEHGVSLVQCGCDVLQGYAIARPMPADELREWLTQWQIPSVWVDVSQVA